MLYGMFKDMSELKYLSKETKTTKPLQSLSRLIWIFKLSEAKKTFLTSEYMCVYAQAHAHTHTYF